MRVERYIILMRTLLLMMAMGVATVMWGFEGVEAVEAVGESPTLPDSIWHDKVTGRQIHLQRLGGLDTLVQMRPNALRALAKDLSINASILSWDYFVQNRDYARISRHVLKDHFSHLPVFDNDSFSGNQFSHPYHGSMFYNTARYEGLSYGVSLLYPILGSATWEWMCETNPPSVNDLLSTGVGGAVLGEVAHRTSDLFFDNSSIGLDRVTREVIGSLLNPVRAVHRILTGEAWRVSHARGKRVEPQPFSFEFGTGYRSMQELKGNRDFLHSPYMEFELHYGQRFNEKKKSRPFDLFSLSLLLNLSDDHPTVGNFEISGRLASKQIDLKKHFQLDIGFYQNLKYVDHYSKHEQAPHNFSLISEAVSFGCQVHAERTTKWMSIQHSFMLSGIVLGGSPADYFPMRRYNFTNGASIRDNTRYYINQKALAGHKFYFARLFSTHGYDAQELQERLSRQEELNCTGDQGVHTIITNNFFIQYNIFKSLRLSFDYQIYYRSSRYAHYPNVHAKSHEWKIGVIHSI